MNDKKIPFSLAAKLSGFFQAAFHQTSIVLCLFLLALLGAILIVVKCILPLATIIWMPIAGFGLVVFLIFVIVGGFVFYLSKMDTTESVLLEDETGKKVLIKSPSKQLIPSIVERLIANNIRPDKLIPEDIDLKADPNQFVSLTEQDKEKIVSEEATRALSEAVKKPFNNPVSLPSGR